MGTSQQSGRGRVVTVSATFGAGGSRVAPAVAERLDLPFFDRLLHGPETRTAERISEQLTEEERRQVPPGRMAAGLARASAGLGIPVPHPADVPVAEHLRTQTQQSLERIWASSGGVVLGRGGAAVLTGRPRVFHVRLDGPQDRRLAQALRLEPMAPEEAAAHQAATDGAWIRFVKVLFGRDPSDPRLYHLVLDSTVLPLDDCAEIIAAAARAYWAADAPL